MILNFRRMSSNIQRCRAAIRNRVGCCRDCVAGVAEVLETTSKVSFIILWGRGSGGLGFRGASFANCMPRPSLPVLVA